MNRWISLTRQGVSSVPCCSSRRYGMAVSVSLPLSKTHYYYPTPLSPAGRRIQTVSIYLFISLKVS